MFWVLVERIGFRAFRSPWHITGRVGADCVVDANAGICATPVRKRPGRAILRGPLRMSRMRQRQNHPVGAAFLMRG
jgi:hypothetical protein